MLAKSPRVQLLRMNAVGRGEVSSLRLWSWGMSTYVGNISHKQNMPPRRTRHYTVPHPNDPNSNRRPTPSIYDTLERLIIGCSRSANNANRNGYGISQTQHPASNLQDYSSHATHSQHRYSKGGWTLQDAPGHNAAAPVTMPTAMATASVKCNRQQASCKTAIVMQLVSNTVPHKQAGYCKNRLATMPQHLQQCQPQWLWHQSNATASKQLARLQ